MESLYVCVACYRSTSRQPGECVGCHVERLPLANPQVREQLGKDAEQRLQKRSYREYFWISAAGFIVTLPLFPFQILFIPVFWIGCGLLVGWLGTVVYARLRPSSALALVSARKQRMARELPPGPDDPAGDDLAVTLKFLGVQID